MTLKERIARALYAAYVTDDNRQSDEAEIVHYKHEPFEKLDNVELRLLNNQAQAALEAIELHVGDEWPTVTRFIKAAIAER